MSSRHPTAAYRAFNITELLELILMNLDQRTLLLSQRVASKWHDIVQSNRGIQKKLFFIQPTFREALQLGVISSRSIVFSTQPCEKTLLNPLVTRLRHSRRVGQAEAEIPISIALERRNHDHGSWERMHFCTKMVKDSGILEFDNVIKVKILKVLNRQSARNPRYGRLYKGDTITVDQSHDGSNGPLRSLMKRAERRILKEYGIEFSWTSATIRPKGYAMKYRVYEKLYRLAQQKHAKKWRDLKCWDRYNDCPPREWVIDEALGHGQSPKRGRAVWRDASPSSSSSLEGVDSSDYSSSDDESIAFHLPSGGSMGRIPPQAKQALETLIRRAFGGRGR